jgi:hypothetical protein
LHSSVCVIAGAFEKQITLIPFLFQDSVDLAGFTPEISTTSVKSVKKQDFFYSGLPVYHQNKKRRKSTFSYLTV